MRMAAVILAAGSSRRFGAANKLLADIGGIPLIAHTLAAVAACPTISEIVVVTGPDADLVADAVATLPVRFVHNPRHANGMGTSIATGIRTLDDDVRGAMIVPGDMPGLTGGLMQRLAAEFVQNNLDWIVYPTLDGQQRNPVIWPRRHFGQLAELDGPQGGKSLLVGLSRDAIGVSITEAGDLLDIDTPEDLAAFRRASR